MAPPAVVPIALIPLTSATANGASSASGSATNRTTPAYRATVAPPQQLTNPTTRPGAHQRPVPVAGSTIQLPTTSVV